mmetsp:Transcript_8656/g.13521  ORF Transcript_8656/g.13521 Transcript_8656/m.13521 type:complete len:84 (+) Transcript_8656:1631-1882(+)
MGGTFIDIIMLPCLRTELHCLSWNVLNISVFASHFTMPDDKLNSHQFSKYGPSKYHALPLARKSCFPLPFKTHELRDSDVFGW